MEKSKVIYIDPMFDGHPEKSILDMTPSERMDYLLMLIEFRKIAKSAIIVKKEKPILKENE
ncbi:MAG: hypothetical protein ABI543_10550 [Ignavibacteria bacterium]